ncbi:uncharacterized protein LOC101863605 [Aplysia californica]|uniref:Uncharacterized protein LOC101863605 n=1 Tax=Aplysia californica TaxID=6500 RepID=A0ABM0K0H7_APLCA|nr:uncharacterized protein LOC101863605 [Aplysia californica]
MDLVMEVTDEENMLQEPVVVDEEEAAEEVYDDSDGAREDLEPCVLTFFPGRRKAVRGGQGGIMVLNIDPECDLDEEPTGQCTEQRPGRSAALVHHPASNQGLAKSGARRVSNVNVRRERSSSKHSSSSITPSKGSSVARMSHKKSAYKHAQPSGSDNISTLRMATESEKSIGGRKAGQSIVLNSEISSRLNVKADPQIEKTSNSGHKSARKCVTLKHVSSAVQDLSFGPLPGICSFLPGPVSFPIADSPSEKRHPVNEKEDCKKEVTGILSNRGERVEKSNRASGVKRVGRTLAARNRINSSYSIEQSSPVASGSEDVQIINAQDLSFQHKQRRGKSKQGKRTNNRSLKTGTGVERAVDCGSVTLPQKLEGSSDCFLLIRDSGGKELFDSRDYKEPLFLQVFKRGTKLLVNGGSRGESTKDSAHPDEGSGSEVSNCENVEPISSAADTVFKRELKLVLEDVMKNKSLCPRSRKSDRNVIDFSVCNELLAQRSTRSDLSDVSESDVSEFNVSVAGKRRRDSPGMGRERDNCVKRQRRSGGAVHPPGHHSVVNGGRSNSVKGNKTERRSGRCPTDSSTSILSSGDEDVDGAMEVCFQTPEKLQVNRKLEYDAKISKAKIRNGKLDEDDLPKINYFPKQKKSFEISPSDASLLEGKTAHVLLERLDVSSLGVNVATISVCGSTSSTSSASGEKDLYKVDRSKNTSPERIPMKPEKVDAQKRLSHSSLCSSSSVPCDVPSKQACVLLERASVDVWEKKTTGKEVLEWDDCSKVICGQDIDPSSNVTADEDVDSSLYVNTDNDIDASSNVNTESDNDINPSSNVKIDNCIDASSNATVDNDIDASSNATVDNEIDASSNANAGNDINASSNVNVDNCADALSNSNTDNEMDASSNANTDNDINMSSYVNLDNCIDTLSNAKTDNNINNDSSNANTDNGIHDSSIVNTDNDIDDSSVVNTDNDAELFEGTDDLAKVDMIRPLSWMPLTGDSDVRNASTSFEVAAVVHAPLCGLSDSHGPLSEKSVLEAKDGTDVDYGTHTEDNRMPAVSPSSDDYGGVLELEYELSHSETAVPGSTHITEPSA